MNCYMLTLWLVFYLAGGGIMKCRLSPKEFCGVLGLQVATHRLLSLHDSPKLTFLFLVVCGRHLGGPLCLIAVAQC